MTGHVHDWHAAWFIPELVGYACSCGATRDLRPRCQKVKASGPRRGLQCLVVARTGGRWCDTHTRAFDRATLNGQPANRTDIGRPA